MSLLSSDRDLGALDENLRWQPGYVFLDYDFRRTPRLAQLFAACHIAGLKVVSIMDRRTKKGWHRVIRLRQRLSPAETVALQAILGSDRRRENLNLMRVLSLRDTVLQQSRVRPTHARAHLLRSVPRKANIQLNWNILFHHKLE